VKIRIIDKTLLLNAYLELVKHMTHQQSSLLIQLRTGNLNSPLNGHLWNIKVVDSLSCTTCGRDEDETVRHFLVLCPAHENARMAARNTRVGASNASNIPLLRTHCKFLKPLFKFVDSTGSALEGNTLIH
jgi:hypothetical protein